MNQFDKRWNGGVQDLPLVSIVIPALDEELTIGESWIGVLKVCAAPG